MESNVEKNLVDLVNINVFEVVEYSVEENSPAIIKDASTATKGGVGFLKDDFGSHNRKE